MPIRSGGPWEFGGNSGNRLEIAEIFQLHAAEAAHATLVAAGIDTDEILRWPGAPAMFAFRDPDGNAFSITETA
jgi:hypothetical protein